MNFEPDVIGDQTPRILALPLDRRVQSAGREAVELAASAGLVLDPWQELVVEHALAMREDGKWCASEIGVMVSRQNGKGSIIEALELWALYINEETVLHTAHLFKTSAEGFRRIEGLILGTPDLKAEVKRIVRGHGEEAIELRSGARLLFGTRTKGAGRGMTLDRIFCDEAMFLTEEQAAALLFTVSAVDNPQTLYLGSAGTQESTHFGRVRARALGGEEPRLCYAEWSIEPCDDFCAKNCEEHDPPNTVDSYAKANPGLGIRISVEHVESEQRSMGPEVFLQERLGVGDWPVEGDAWGVISEESWMSRVDEASAIDGNFVLAIDTDPKPTYACIAAAGLNADGLNHVEVTGYETLDYRPGVKWVVGRALEICRGMRPKAVVIDKTSHASSFIDELTEPLEKLGIVLLHPNSNEFAQACGDFYTAIIPRKGNAPTLVHIDQAPLTSAVAGADTRDLTGMWAWGRRASAVDISPLVASTLAMWGFKKMQYHKAPSAPWMVRR